MRIAGPKNNNLKFGRILLEDQKRSDVSSFGQHPQLLEPLVNRYVVVRTIDCASRTKIHFLTTVRKSTTRNCLILFNSAGGDAARMAAAVPRSEDKDASGGQRKKCYA